MHRFFGVILVVLVYLFGCFKRATPAERFCNATEIFFHDYTNLNIQVAERALRNYRVFLSDEEKIYSIKDLKLIYAITTERLARICEHTGAIHEAVTLRDEIEKVATNEFFTMEEVALLVTKIDAAHGVGTNIWVSASGAIENKKEADSETRSD